MENYPRLIFNIGFTSFTVAVIETFKISVILA